MWKPYYEKKQGIISRWLERRRQVIGNMAEESQFPFKQVQIISESQGPLGPDQRSIENIPKNAKTVYPKEKKVEIRILSTEQAQAEIYVYAARLHDGLVDVCSGFVATGNQWEVRNGQKYYFVHNIQIEDHWFSEIYRSQRINGSARIMFETHGYNRVFVRLKFNTGKWLIDIAGA